MTKWKTRPTFTLFESQAHHSWSRLRECTLQAAEQLGLPVAKANHYDRWSDNWSTVYYTSAEALAKVGGYGVLCQAIEPLHAEAMAPYMAAVAAGEVL